VSLYYSACCEKENDVVELRQPTELPQNLICNILPVDKNGVKVRSRVKLQESIGVYDVFGARHSYEISAFIVSFT
jgi:hypothetical protein